MGYVEVPWTAHRRYPVTPGSRARDLREWVQMTTTNATDLLRAARLGTAHSDRDVAALAKPSLEMEADRHGVDLTDPQQWAAYVTAWAVAHLTGAERRAVAVAAELAAHDQATDLHAARG